MPSHQQWLECQPVKAKGHGPNLTGGEGICIGTGSRKPIDSVMYEHQSQIEV